MNAIFKSGAPRATDRSIIRRGDEWNGSQQPVFIDDCAYTKLYWYTASRVTSNWMHQAYHANVLRLYVCDPENDENIILTFVIFHRA